MSADLVERVARAICAARDSMDADEITGGPHPGGLWLDIGEPWRHGDVEAAQAAIAEISAALTEQAAAPPPHSPAENSDHG